jgi:hypothetical protein
VRPSVDSDRRRACPRCARSWPLKSCRCSRVEPTRERAP